MRLTIGDTTRRYMKTLGIVNFPFTSSELKNKFIKLIKENHPDVNKNSCAKRTRSIIEANNQLKNLVVETLDSVANNVIIDDADDDMFTLIKECPNCEGKKVETKQRWVKKKCTDCNGTKKVMLPCQRCSGVGYREPEKINKCPMCKGSGNFKEIECKTCFTDSRDKDFWDYFFGDSNGHYEDVITPCSKCKGKGEVIVTPFNPVIRKGAVL